MTRSADDSGERGVETLQVDEAAPPGTGPPPAAAPEARELIDDRYEILSWLGRGSMGNVYKVRDRQLDERVALKSLQRRFVENDEAVEQFHHEVKMARRVTHRNVARTFDLGTEGDTPYLTMELIEGGTLKRIIRRDAPMGIEDFVRFVDPICRALEAAHAVSVIHRDLKPQNVMITQSKRVVVTDFGVARQVATSDAGDPHSGTVGTPGYMAPEQVEGAGDVDGRADIYALGVMMYEMLTGELPWKGKNPTAVAFARCIQPSPELPDDGQWPERIRRTVAGCLKRDPEERVASAQQVREVLADSDDLQFDSYPGAESSGTVAPETSVGGSSAARKAIAVLPLTFHGPEDRAHLADGVTEEIIDQLSRTEELAVLPRGSVAQFEDVDVDPREAGRRLDVQIIVQGTLREFADTTRIRTAVISVQEGFQLWGRTYEADPEELLEVGQRAARAVERAVTVAPVETSRKGPSDPAAIDLYIRGRHALKENWYSEMTGAIELFEQALDRAPDNPRILAALAAAEARAAFLDDPHRRAHTDRAAETARKAIETAPDWPEPHVALALAHYNAVDFGPALEALDRALELAPDFYQAHDLRGRLLAEVGPLDEAIDHLQQALEYNPYLYTTRWDLARAHALRGDWEKADLLMEREVDDTWARVLQYAHQARLDLWRDEPRWADEPPEPAAPEESMYSTLPRIQREVARTGDLTDAHRATLAESLDRRGEDSRFLSMLYQVRAELGAAAGDSAYALTHLENACRAGLVDTNWLAGCPLLEQLAGTSAFAQIVETVDRRVAAIRPDVSDNTRGD